MSIKVQILIAEDVETQGPINKVVNPVLKMRVPFIPGGLTFSISVITSGINPSRDHEFSVMLIDPSKEEDNNNRVMYTTGIQRLNANAVMTDNFNINIDMKSQPFYSQGTYQVVLKIDEETFDQKFEVVANQVFEIPEGQR